MRMTHPRCVFLMWASIEGQELVWKPHPRHVHSYTTLFIWNKENAIEINVSTVKLNKPTNHLALKKNQPFSFLHNDIYFQ